jgi:4-hydroxy-3-polyprenylbenzoate decarboxylase
VREFTESNRIIIGISGASGVIFGIELLKNLKALGCETHLILTEAARKNIVIETDYSVKEVETLADKTYENEDLAAPLASGSFITRGMIVAPCTIKSLSAIAHSYNDSLLIRAADVCLKERRKLVLLVRETPLHQGHLRLMSLASEMGALILPPIPAFYHHPKTIQDIINQTVGKVLDYFQIDHQLYRRWEGIP